MSTPGRLTLHYRGDVREDFAQRVKIVLARRVQGWCSNPGCRVATSGPGLDPDRAVNVGVAAHITAASPGGPRYDPALTPDERVAAANGIWLCQRCAKLVDDDWPRYTVDVLHSWKAQAEIHADAILAFSAGAAAATPPGAIRVRDASWLHLGVHRPIQVASTDPASLPTYVPRDIDGDPNTGLWAQVTTAARHGGFIVLVGESSTGKTRSLFEAVTALLGDWWLLRPSDVAATSLAEVSLAPPNHLVVWLDSLQNHMGPGGLDAASVRRLTAGGAVLLGELWPHLHDEYASPPSAAFHSDSQDDPRVVARQVLELATVIHLPRKPTQAENNRTSELSQTANDAAGDLWLKAALEVTDYGFTQTIAAAPQLTDRWDNAGPYARAVLTAAVDARRLGVLSAITGSFLQHAAPGYCSAAERAQAPADWFDRSLAYCTRLLLGAVAPLTPVSAGMTMGAVTGYLLADYLAQHAEPERWMQCPPASFWDACIDHIADSAELERLGMHAADRMRYRYAIPLLRRANSRNWGVATRLAFLVGDQGYVDEAIAMLRGVAYAGDPMAEYQLAKLLPVVDEWRAAGKRDIPTPAQEALMLKGLAGSRSMRLTLDSSKIRAVVTEMFGDVDELRRRYRADSGDINAALGLVHSLACTGDFDESLPIRRALVDRGVPEAGDELTATLVELGRRQEAYRLARFGLSADGCIENSPVQPLSGPCRTMIQRTR